MTLIEGFLKDEFIIDFGSDPVYGSDQVFMSYPCRFATVHFQLMVTSGLSQIADRTRKDMGYKPLHPMDEYTEETCDRDGWYEFSIGINDYSDTRMDSCIEFIVISDTAEDNEECYEIYLTPEEQEYIYSQLDMQCRCYLGKGCVELLSDARKEMEEQN